jgi:hypothetical protein
MRTLEFEDKIDGRKQRRIEIAAIRVQFLGAPPSDGMTAEASAEAHVLAEADVPF